LGCGGWGARLSVGEVLDGRTSLGHVGSFADWPRRMKETD